MLCSIKVRTIALSSHMLRLNTIFNWYTSDLPQEGWLAEAWLGAKMPGLHPFSLVGGRVEWGEVGNKAGMWWWEHGARRWREMGGNGLGDVGKFQLTLSNCDWLNFSIAFSWLRMKGIVLSGEGCRGCNQVGGGRGGGGWDQVDRGWNSTPLSPYPTLQNRNVGDLWREATAFMLLYLPAPCSHCCNSLLVLVWPDLLPRSTTLWAVELGSVGQSSMERECRAESNASGVLDDPNCSPYLCVNRLPLLQPELCGATQS